MNCRFLFQVFVLWLAAISCVEAQKIGEVSDYDPSIDAPGEPHENPLVRFRADFNNDGLMDVAISVPKAEPFMLYLGTADGKWRYLGNFIGHLLATHLEKSKKGEGIVTTYLRGGAGKGNLFRFSISDRGIRELSKKEIRPDETGNPEDRKEYLKYFDDAVRLHGEACVIVKGRYTW